MEWWTPLDQYCERLGPGFLAEPLNALSNISFLIAALFAWRHYCSVRQEVSVRSVPILSLLLLLTLIGIGSFCFHTFAVYWALLADVLPITLFIYLYIGVVMREVFMLNWSTTALTLVAFLLMNIAAEAFIPVHWLNGSVLYLPACLALVVIYVKLPHIHPLKRTFLTIIGLFAVSLTFRTIDNMACSFNPWGTHYWWHLFNGYMLYLCLEALIRNHQQKYKPHLL